MMDFINPGKKDTKSAVKKKNPATKKKSTPPVKEKKILASKKTESPIKKPPAKTEEDRKRESPIWRVKYRPTALQQVRTINKKIHKQFQSIIASKNMPHLMLVGPTESGKLALAEILARELLGSEYNLNAKILYATDPISKEERKETKSDGYVSTKHLGSSAGETRNLNPFLHMRVEPFVATKRYGDSPFKVLIIKDFHQLGNEQQAFRRIMERYSNNCRMILISDKISGIIDPIVSRCQIIMVPFMKEPLFIKTLKDVCDKEKINVNRDILEKVRNISNNSMGKALDLLQLTLSKYGIIDLIVLSKMNSEINHKVIHDLFSKATSNNFVNIRKSLREIFTNNKLSKNDILTMLSQVILEFPLQRKVRAFLIDLIAQTDFDSRNGNEDEIHLNNLLMKISLVFQGIKKTGGKN